MKMRPVLTAPVSAQPDHLDIAVRAFAPPPQKPKTRRPKATPPSEWTLVFDTETTIDAAQRLRIGAYQFRKGDELDEAGLFYDPAVISAAESTALRRFASENHLTLRTAAEFVENVLFDRAYDLRASIVGFNLPFDISRLAIRHGSARGKVMRGGFTFKLSQRWWRPNIQIRHLNARASLIQFAHPPKQRSARGQRKRKIEARERRGSFVDLKTIAAALLSRSFGLASLADFLKTETRKSESGGHGKELNEQYLRYAVQDVQATFECFQALRDRYALHGIEETPIGKILSEASLGKAYLKQMGIRPFRKVQPDFLADLIGKIISAYFGGRAEIRWRREIRQVLYCDFLSMYPTVCTLMGLWRFVIAQGMEWRDSTEETRRLVNSVSLDELQSADFWPQLTTIVRVAPKTDIFPVRAKYDGRSQTIGLNYLTSETPLWFTLADVIAAKLLGGKSPEILEAVTFSPKEPQTGLKAISIAGNSDCRINPATDDFFKRLIDLRTAIKGQLKNSTALNRDALESEQQALKILANSTSYGIFVEFIVHDLDAPERLLSHGPGDEAFAVETKKIEKPGLYFHPLLATLITGAARLMLGIVERLCVAKGLDWAFCDTDSMATAKPVDMGQSEFFERAQSICEWFSALNPYEKKGPIFKIEDANYPIAGNGGDSQFELLYCYCISAKRYVLFNRGSAGEIIIRKASAHGLGHFLPPYETDSAPQSIPAPSVELSQIGVERWHYDLWFKIVEAALAGHPDQVDLSYHPGLSQPAASRYGATTPALLKWFEEFNHGRDYPDQVKPFNFLSAFQAQLQLQLPDEHQPALPKRGRPRKQLDPKPIAAFNRDPGAAAQEAFDRETGKPIAAGQLKTYAETLAQYHLRPEAKFLNGNFCDRGRTVRRHVIAEQILHIGKEANKWEEQHYLGEDEDAEIDYSIALNGNFLVEGLRQLCEEYGQRKTAEMLGVSRSTIVKVLGHGSAALSTKLRDQIGRRRP